MQPEKKRLSNISLVQSVLIRESRHSNTASLWDTVIRKITLPTEQHTGLLVRIPAVILKTEKPNIPVESQLVFRKQSVRCAAQHTEISPLINMSRKQSPSS